MLFHTDRNGEAPVHLTVSWDKTQLLSAMCLKSCEGVSTGQAEEHDRSDQRREPNSDLLDVLSLILPM